MHRRWLTWGAVVLVAAGAIGAYVLHTINAHPFYRHVEGVLRTDISRDHRAVDAVACRPHTKLLVTGETYDFQCRVSFHDGSSYTPSVRVITSRISPDRYYWPAPPDFVPAP